MTQAILDKVPEENLKLFGLLASHLKLVEVGGEHTIKNHATHALWENLRIHSGNCSAITLAHHVHDRIADKRAGNIHVLGNFYRGHVRNEWVISRLACRSNNFRVKD